MERVNTDLRERTSSLGQFRHPVVAMGNFDGVHLGHRRIIQLALDKTRAREGNCLVYTFRPHPQHVLRPELVLPLISTYDEKLALLDTLGVDAVIEQPFTLEFSKTEPRDFFSRFLMGQLKAECIVVGYDFAFGKGRNGQLDLLKDLCEKAGVELVIVPPEKLSGEVVSSSRIRGYLSEGAVERAQNFLGRPFSYESQVIRADGRGSKIGFPTANFILSDLEEKILLPRGVYATWSRVSGKKFPSVTNIGVRPTFKTSGDPSLVWIETHLIDTHFDLYDQTLEVSFIKRIRDEKKFDHIDQLVDQIRADIQQAKITLVY